MLSQLLSKPKQTHALLITKRTEAPAIIAKDTTIISNKRIKVEMDSVQTMCDKIRRDFKKYRIENSTLAVAVDEKVKSLIIAID